MIAEMRRLVAEAYIAFVEEYEAWQMCNEEDPEYFDNAPDFFDFIARYLISHGALLE